MADCSSRRGCEPRRAPPQVPRPLPGELKASGSQPCQWSLGNRDPGKYPPSLGNQPAPLGSPICSRPYRTAARPRARAEGGGAGIFFPTSPSRGVWVGAGCPSQLGPGMRPKMLYALPEAGGRGRGRRAFPLFWCPRGGPGTPSLAQAVSPPQIWTAPGVRRDPSSTT